MSGYKRKVAQSDLRILMTEKKRKLLEAKKKVDSPLAKYQEDGSILCIVCKFCVKNETIWNIHINSKQHKENIKKSKNQFTTVDSAAQPVCTVKLHNNFLRKEESDSARIISVMSPSPLKLKGILKNTVAHDSLPSDFYNEGLPVKKMAVDLPEGFFDDPVMDAKARNIEYKDPNEEEWERFQREIMHEKESSSQMADEDYKEAIADRQLEEIDEQLYKWTRILNLEVKKEKIQEAVVNIQSALRDYNNSTNNDDADSSYGSEDECAEFLDWRCKRSFQ